MIPDIAHSAPVEGSSNRSFGLVFAAVFLLVAVWPAFAGSGSLRLWALGLSALFLLLALFLPESLSALNRLWMRFGLLLGKVVSPVALGIVFLGVVLPIGLYMRFTGKDLLRLKFDHGAKSYWVPRDPPGPDPKTLNHLF